MQPWFVVAINFHCILFFFSSRETMRRRDYYLRGKMSVCVCVFISYAATDKHCRNENIYWNCFYTLIDPSVIFINSSIIGCGAKSLEMAGEMADEECTQRLISFIWHEKKFAKHSAENNGIDIYLYFGFSLCWMRCDLVSGHCKATLKHDDAIKTSR